MISGITYVLTGNGSSPVARIGRWLALGADGRPRLDRLAIGAAVAVVSIVHRRDDSDAAGDGVCRRPGCADRLEVDRCNG